MLYSLVFLKETNPVLFTAFVAGLRLLNRTKHFEYLGKCYWLHYNTINSTIKKKKKISDSNVLYSNTYNTISKNTQLLGKPLKHVVICSSS